MRPSWKVAGWRIEQLGRGVLPDVAGHDKRAVDAQPSLLAANSEARI